MSEAIQPTSIIPVNVTTDWSTATNAANDVIVALETSFPGVFAFPADDAYVMALTQVQSGISVKASLSIAATSGVGTWAADWTTHPVIGSVAYIIDMY
jgi:hypothetical protein